MRIYDIHNQHPEWVENPTEHRAEIREAAHAYIWDFFKMGADVRDRVLLRDLNAIADNRSQILAYWEYNGNPEAEPTEYRQSRTKCAILERVFKLILRYLAYYGYILQYEDITAFYIGREDKELNFVNIEDWPTNQTEAQEKSLKEFIKDLHDIEHYEAKQTTHFNLGNETAAELYKELKDSKTIIDCCKDDFLWYFGSDEHRNGKEKPEQIKWQGNKKDFAYFCLLVSYQLGGQGEQIAWSVFISIFTDYKSGCKWDSKALATDVNKMKYSNKLPAKFKITTLQKGITALNEEIEMIAKKV